MLPGGVPAANHAVHAHHLAGLYIYQQRGCLYLFVICKVSDDLMRRQTETGCPAFLYAVSQQNNNQPVFGHQTGATSKINMKKLFVSLVLCLMSIGTFAQKEVTVKAGTMVPLHIVNPTKAADVNVGQKVTFRVSRDINVDGVTAIPYGTTVNGTVYEAKKSSWWGTKGRLGIKITGMYAPNGELIPLDNGNVYVTGENRTAISILVFCFTGFPLPCGSKAEIPMGYELLANVASNTVVKVN